MRDRPGNRGGLDIRYGNSTLLIWRQTVRQAPKGIMMAETQYPDKPASNHNSGIDAHL